MKLIGPSHDNLNVFALGNPNRLSESDVHMNLIPSTICVESLGEDHLIQESNLVHSITRFAVSGSSGGAHTPRREMALSHRLLKDPAQHIHGNKHVIIEGDEILVGCSVRNVNLYRLFHPALAEEFEGLNTIVVGDPNGLFHMSGQFIHVSRPLDQGPRQMAEEVVHVAIQEVDLPDDVLNLRSLLALGEKDMLDYDLIRNKVPSALVVRDLPLLIRQFLLLEKGSQVVTGHVFHVPAPVPQGQYVYVSTSISNLLRKWGA